MRYKRYRTFKKILTIFAFLLVVVCVFSASTNISYALKKQVKPDVIIEIDKHGKISYSGNLYDDALWYPGFKKNGVIRINNNYRAMVVRSFGVGVDMKKTAEGYNKDLVYNSFLRNMKLTIKAGRLTAFNRTIINNKSLSELVCKKSSSKVIAYGLRGSDQFGVLKNSYVDLQYTLKMDYDSGNELENLIADVAFLINVEQLTVPPNV